MSLAYLALWLLAFQVSNVCWFLPAGLRFTVLWLCPRRQWGWFAAADVSAILALSIVGIDDQTWTSFALTTLAPWCSCALVIWLIRPHGVYAAPESPSRMGSTLTAMLLAATVSAGAQSGGAVLESGASAHQWPITALGYLLREYVGMLMCMVMLAPIRLQQLARRTPGQDGRRLLFDLGVMFTPLLVMLAMLQLWRAPASSYAGILALVPMMLMAFRHGWRGAAWALTISSVTLYLVRVGSEQPLSNELLQLFLAIVGSVALLLGSAIESLRRANAALIERNHLEKQANARLADQAVELRDLSRRLVRAREDEQARLAHELHDELGQCVTALGTRLSLIARQADDPEILAELHAQRELVQRIQVSIREVLQGLRPPMLDRFGLPAALREGPIQRLLVDAGIEYDLTISGPIERVGSDTGSAIYRICQETATNCVRHAQATHFRLHIDVTPTWAGDSEVQLRIEDDGRGFDIAAVEASSRSGGLRGIRDRVMALAGETRCESCAEGTRHMVWFVDRAPQG